MIEEIHIYDFDDTLFDTNGSQEFIEEISQEAKRSINNPKVVTALCTAREGDKETIEITRGLLESEGIVFDYHIFKPHYILKPNCIYKEIFAAKLIGNHPEASKLVLWDDCEDNLDYVGITVRNMGLDYVPVKC